MKSAPHIAGWQDPPMAVCYLDGLADAVVVVDVKGTMYEGNPEFFHFARASRDELMGHPVARVLESAPGLRPFVASVERLAPEGAARRDLVELEVPSQTLVLTTIPLAPVDGLPLMAVRVEDITDMVRERAEIDAQHLAAQENALALERLNEELEGFSYSVAHDLRAPLRFIDKFAYLLVERHGAELSPVGRHYAEQIREGSRQMAQLVEALLEFSRVTGQELKRVPIDMTRLARQVAEEVQQEVEGRQVAFAIGELGVTHGDPTLIRQVLWNLVSNAVKFTRDRERAEITLERNDDVVPPSFTVADNGVGFESELADRLFTVFQRFHQPEDYEGSGVGLAVVKRIVNRHGGVIWAESSIGHGARFHFTLDAAPQRRIGGPSRGA
jgi:light-regulated signal transduction histidine kinase (bacteriophytochrome)